MKKIMLLACFIAGIQPLQSMGKTTVNISFMHDGLSINGRLQLPDGTGPFKVIIIAPGSGANDRNATLPMLGSNVMCLYPGLYGDTLRPYQGLSDALSDSGYAVLTYDKVEYTYPNPSPITFNRLWLPVESAIKYVKTRSDIDVDNIILLGHSEGASLIPFISHREPSVKALISLAGPRTPFDSILAHQVKFITKTCNGDTSAANAQADQILQYYHEIRIGNWNSSTPPLFGISAQVWSEYINVIDSVVYNYNKAQRPTLFIGLGDDINVPVSTEWSRFKNDVTIGADFYSLPGLNHYFTTPTSPLTSEILTDTIIYWLRKNTTSITDRVKPAKSGFLLINSDKKIHIKSTGDIITKVNVYNTMGTRVSVNIVNNRQYTFDGNFYTPGYYFVHVIGNFSNEVFKTVLY